MTVHHFSPITYYTSLGAHSPACSIQPGDSVITTTVDASGRDPSGEPVTTGGNPQTGPFFVQGAEPGDILVVHFARITPNRSSGWTSKSLAYNVLDPGFVAELARQTPQEKWQPTQWDIDLNANTATLRAVDTPLGRFSLPLQPMLGCFGVAPGDGQFISTATSAEHGGNMDYRGFAAGSSVYLPIFVPGALFFLGDGHAVQGDGEIAGTGIEVSMEVEFHVELIKGKSIGWPRGENATHIFTTGNARPLDQALQHCTTEMARWLMSDYNLDPASVGLLMGQSVQYEVGNVFDPAYTMVCKLEKKVLAGLPK